MGGRLKGLAEPLGVPARAGMALVRCAVIGSSRGRKPDFSVEGLLHLIIVNMVCLSQTPISGVCVGGCWAARSVVLGCVGSPDELCSFCSRSRQTGFSAAGVGSQTPVWRGCST